MWNSVLSVLFRTSHNLIKSKGISSKHVEAFGVSGSAGHVVFGVEGWLDGVDEQDDFRCFAVWVPEIVIGREVFMINMNSKESLSDVKVILNGSKLLEHWLVLLMDGFGQLLREVSALVRHQHLVVEHKATKNLAQIWEIQLGTIVFQSPQSAVLSNFSGELGLEFGRINDELVGVSFSGGDSGSSSVVQRGQSDVESVVFV